MRADLTKDLSKDDVEHLERLWKESGLLREIVCKAIEAKLIQAISAEDSVNQYKDPHWSLRVADSRGYRRGLKYAIDFLKQRISAE